MTLRKNTTNACRVTRVCFLIIEHRENPRGIKAPCGNRASSRIRGRFSTCLISLRFYIDLSMEHGKLLYCYYLGIILSLQRCLFCLNRVFLLFFFFFPFLFFFSERHAAYPAQKIFALGLSRPMANCPMGQFCE
jgi:hypothetical protein